jgi:uncharacterized C2H2 Zn-finger protein
MRDKSGNLFIRCPKCHHLNISDNDFYEIRCNDCNEMFINKMNTIHVLESLWEN